MADPAKLHELYKILRNQIRKYSARSIIERISYHLSDDYVPENSTGRPPHALLFILKITVLYGRYRGSKSHIQEGQLNGIYNIWHDMQKYGKMPTDYESLGVWTRLVAYQQFWLQRPLNYPDIA